jgi:chemotaxis protein histidine kinase CheA
MALAEKYVILFQKECLDLSKTVLNNLHRLKANPNDNEGIEKMLQAADTMIGDSRFIKNRELEQACLLLVKTFNEVENVSNKSKEVDFFIEIFSKIISD